MPSPLLGEKRLAEHQICPHRHLIRHLLIQTPGEWRRLCSGAPWFYSCRLFLPGEQPFPWSASGKTKQNKNFFFSLHLLVCFVLYVFKEVSEVRICCGPATREDPFVSWCPCGCPGISMPADLAQGLDISCPNGGAVEIAHVFSGRCWLLGPLGTESWIQTESRMCFGSGWPALDSVHLFSWICRLSLTRWTWLQRDCCLWVSPLVHSSSHSQERASWFTWETSLCDNVTCGAYHLALGNTSAGPLNDQTAQKRDLLIYEVEICY